MVSLVSTPLFFTQPAGNGYSFAPWIGKIEYPAVLELSLIHFMFGCFQKNCTPKSSILIGFSIINHPFWGTVIFGNTLCFNIPSIIAIFDPAGSGRWQFSHVKSWWCFMKFSVFMQNDSKVPKVLTWRSDYLPSV